MFTFGEHVSPTCAVFGRSPRPPPLLRVRASTGSGCAACNAVYC